MDLNFYIKVICNSTQEFLGTDKNYHFGHKKCRHKKLRKDLEQAEHGLLLPMPFSSVKKTVHFQTVTSLLFLVAICRDTLYIACNNMTWLHDRKAAQNTSWCASRESQTTIPGTSHVIIEMIRFIMNKDNIDMLRVIGDFIELGLVENIVAMFKQDTSLYALTGDLVRDERFNVRLGTAVLFEELAQVRPTEVSLAIPALLPLLQGKNPILRGEAATLLGIIGTKAALEHLLPLENDADPQVREIISDIINPEP